MTKTRNTVLWLAAGALAVAAGSVAVITGSPGPDVLTAGQASDRLAEARASAAPAGSFEALAEDEWYGSLPSAGVVARCAGGKMELVRWSGPGRLRDFKPGPAATVSGGVGIDDGGVTFTGHCAGAMPTGSYRWLVSRDHPTSEPAEKIEFGKWTTSDTTVCASPAADPPAADLTPCPRVPVMMLSVPPA